MRPSPRSRTTIAVLVLLLGVLGSLAGARPAAAAQAGWVDFSAITGTSRDYAFTMQQPAAGFPLAEVTSTASTASTPTGASTFLPPQTPPGATYGSSRNSEYMLLAPGTTAGSSSVTTYTFTRPTPATGWTFVLGDVDSDRVQVSATDADGLAVPVADLGFRGVFNYCAPGVSPKPSCSPPNNNGLDLPTWDPGTGILSGNPTAADSAGASGWFEPTVALSTLTFTFTQRSGRPVYQTWFSALAYDVTGTVSAPVGQQGGITMRLIDPSGAVVATTTTAGNGSYSFPGYATYADYVVELARPDGLTADGSLRQPADLSGDDAVVDFALRAIVPAAVGGTVTDDAGGSLGGVPVTLTPDGGGDPLTAITSSDGGYLFDQVEAGDYTWSIDPPAGYTTQESPDPLTVPADSEVPIPDQDFVLIAAPTGSLTGTVTDDDGTPVGGVRVLVTGPGGEQLAVFTDPDDGTYSLTDLPVGDYTIEIEVPDGYRAVGPTSREPTIPAGGGAIADQDFQIELLPTGVIAGTVSLDDAPPAAPVVVELTDSDGANRIEQVDPDTGVYTFADVPPGTYAIAVTPPPGTRAEGGASRTVVIDEDGTSVTDVDFILVSLATPTPTPTPTPTVTPTPPPSPSPTTVPTESPSSAPTTVPTTGPTAAAPGTIPDTGGSSLWWLVGGVVAIAVGASLVLARTGSHRH